MKSTDNLKKIRLLILNLINNCTYGNSVADWSKSMTWPSGSWSTSYSETLIDSTDSTKIYTVFSYGSTSYVYFLSMNVTNGDVIGSRYKSSISLISVYGFKQNGDYLLATIYNPFYHLLLINTQSFSFII